MPTPGESVMELAAFHHETWRDKSDWFWFLRLLMETIELGSSLLGLHRRAPERKMCQIASICINWMWKRVDE